MTAAFAIVNRDDDDVDGGGELLDIDSWGMLKLEKNIAFLCLKVSENDRDHLHMPHGGLAE